MILLIDFYFTVMILVQSQYFSTLYSIHGNQTNQERKMTTPKLTRKKIQEHYKRSAIAYSLFLLSLIWAFRCFTLI